MNFKGVIIEESLEDKSVFSAVQIIETKVEQATEKHRTPWIKQWTLHSVEIPEEKAENIAEKISNSIDNQHESSWFADFKNDKFHYIIFRDKVFKVGLENLSLYEKAREFGASKGIPPYQMQFEQLER